MEFPACAAVLALIASFLSPLAAAVTSGRIERGVISDMAVVGDDQNAGFSGESIGRSGTDSPSPPFYAVSRRFAF